MPTDSCCSSNDDDVKYWEKQYAALQLFFEKHGHSRIPYSSDSELSQWVVQQRCGLRWCLQALTPDRIARLDKLNISFTPIVRRRRRSGKQQRVQGDNNNLLKQPQKLLSDLQQQQQPGKINLLESSFLYPIQQDLKGVKALKHVPKWEGPPSGSPSSSPELVDDASSSEERELVDTSCEEEQLVDSSSSDKVEYEPSSSGGLRVIEGHSMKNSATLSSKTRRRSDFEILEVLGDSNHSSNRPLKKRRFIGFQTTNVVSTARNNNNNKEEALDDTNKSTRSLGCFTDRYPVGTRVLKDFAGYGWFSGSIVSVVKQDSYFVQYADGDEESYLPEESDDLDQIVANYVQILRHPVGTRVQKYMHGWGWCQGEISSIHQSSYCIQYHHHHKREQPHHYQLKDEYLSFDRVDELDHMVSNAQKLKHSVGTPVQTFIEDHGWQNGKIVALEKDRYCVEYENDIQEDFYFHQLEELDRLVENAHQVHPAIRYPMGTQVRKYVRGSGWLLGEVVSIRHDRYIIQYENDREEEFLLVDTHELDEIVGNVKALQDILKYPIGTCVIKFVEGRGWCSGKVVSIKRDRYVVAYKSDEDVEDEEEEDEGEREHFLFRELSKLDELVVTAKSMQGILKHKVGTRVKKFFEGYGWFTGEIVSIDSDRYNVLYLDGDSEEYLFADELDDLDEIVTNGTLSK